MARFAEMQKAELTVLGSRVLGVWGLWVKDLGGKHSNMACAV